MAVNLVGGTTSASAALAFNAQTGTTYTFSPTANTTVYARRDGGSCPASADASKAIVVKTFIFRRETVKAFFRICPYFNARIKHII
jgi:hypothetical protein